MSGVENPAAFPSRKDEPMRGGGSYRNDEPGMSLRDWFAGQALSGIIITCGSDTGTREKGHAAYFAEKAFEIADALLVARQNGGAA